MRLEKMPSTMADTTGGAPHATSTDRNACLRYSLNQKWVR
jgi:hypothetical protein